MATDLGVPLLVAAGVTAAAVLALRRTLQVVQVTGDSMAPAYRTGDRLLVRRRRGAVPRGAVVVFRTPHRAGRAATDVGWLVKRVVATPGDAVPAQLRTVVPEPVVPPGCVLVRGDNPHSVDSRHFGYVRHGDLLGVAVRRLRTTDVGEDGRSEQRRRLDRRQTEASEPGSYEPVPAPTFRTVRASPGSRIRWRRTTYPSC